MAETGVGDPSLLEILPVGIFAVDRRWTLNAWNGTLAAWTGIAPDEALGRDLRAVLPRFAERRYLARLESVMEGGPPVVFSYQLHTNLFPDAQAHRRRRERYCTANRHQGTGGIVFVVEDRTEAASLIREARLEVARRRSIEEALRAALAAKEMLIREASHRVKNNLGMIVSLISLEASRAGDQAARGFLLDLQSRVDSIGLIHDLLYRGEVREDVSLDEYLRRLVSTIVDTFSKGGAGAELSLSLEPARMDLDGIPYLGMVVSELLTNSLKYGRAPGGALRVRLSLRRGSPPDGLEILVEDEGPGFQGGQPRPGNSLGWGLLEMLVGQLRGRLEILPGPGARVLVRFPGAPRQAPAA